MAGKDDMGRVRRHVIEDGHVHLQFRQSKTNKQLKVKVHSRLKAMLDAWDKDTLRILLNSRKRPWTKDGFKTSWERVHPIAYRGRHVHDPRGTFIIERAREGSSVENIAKTSCHSILEIKSVLEKHYLADDQDASDAVIIRMKNGLPKP